MRKIYFNKTMLCLVIFSLFIQGHYLRKKILVWNPNLNVGHAGNDFFVSKHTLKRAYSLLIYPAYDTKVLMV